MPPDMPEAVSVYGHTGEWEELMGVYDNLDKRMYNDRPVYSKYGEKKHHR